jgi:hypothetical protein
MSRKQQVAPIILFVYNRPDHTQRTVESLAKNNLAKDSTLYIFSDAAKNDEEKEKVSEVRRYVASLNELKYFSSISIKEADKNRGLATSIISGVAKVMQIHGRAIILEDDLLSAPDFLDFMNKSLDFYEKDSSIGSISGYSPIAVLPATYKDSVWVASRTSSLGWATWKDRWEKVKWEIDDYETFKKDKKARKKFDECGSDRYDRFRRQIEVGANSWSIRFGYWQSRAGLNTIFPSVTRIQHIGWDGSGVHGTYNGPLDTQVKPYPVDFELKHLKPNSQIISMLKSIYSGPLLSRLARYLRNNGFKNFESKLRTIVRK